MRALPVAHVPVRRRSSRAAITAPIRGTAAETAEALRRRRDRTGISHLQVGGMSAEEFAPVVELPAGT